MKGGRGRGEGRRRVGRKVKGEGAGRDREGKEEGGEGTPQENFDKSSTDMEQCRKDGYDDVI